MMTDREKLVGLIKTIPTRNGYTDVEDIADHLIANGVTVQEWISVEDKLPEGKSKVLVFWFSNVHEVTYLGDGTFRTLAGQSVIIGRDVKYWMPLPEPPKKEENSNE